MCRPLQLKKCNQFSQIIFLICAAIKITIFEDIATGRQQITRYSLKKEAIVCCHTILYPRWTNNSCQIWQSPFPDGQRNVQMEILLHIIRHQDKWMALYLHHILLTPFFLLSLKACLQTDYHNTGFAWNDSISKTFFIQIIPYFKAEATEHKYASISS